MQIRVLVFGIPEMLREIVVGLLAKEPDFDIIAPSSVATGLSEAVERYAPDVLVSGATVAWNGADGAYAELFRADLRLKVITVAEDGRDGYLYRLRPERVPLGELSSECLAKAVREPWLGPAGSGESLMTPGSSAGRRRSKF